MSKARYELRPIGWVESPLVDRDLEPGKPDCQRQRRRVPGLDRVDRLTGDTNLFGELTLRQATAFPQRTDLVPHACIGSLSGPRCQASLSCSTADHYLVDGRRTA